MKIALKIRIHGDVHLVGFRHFVMRNAQRLEIVGYVKNMDDGTVSAYLVGEEANVQELISLCKKGPERSSVELVEVFNAQVLKFNGFEIRK